MEQAVFWFFASWAVAAALLCITRKSPVASALWLVQTMFSLAAMYVLLDAHFIAALQVLVYAGAIMVLFLFVIMLLNLGRDERSDMAGTVWRIAMGAMGIGVFAVLFVAVTGVRDMTMSLPEGTLESMQQQQGAVGIIAEPLFRGFLIPFELTSMLLLAAVVGAVVLAKRKV